MASPVINLAPADTDRVAVRRELQHFLLLHSLQGNLRRLRAGLSAAGGAEAGCEDVAARFDSGCALSLFSDTGVAGRSGLHPPPATSSPIPSNLVESNRI